MALDHEKAKNLRQAAEEYLAYKPIYTEEGQPRLTDYIDKHLKALKQVMDTGIEQAYIDQGNRLRDSLVEIYKEFYDERPNDLMIAYGVITAFEHLHPENDMLASVGLIRRITSVASEAWGGDFALPSMLDVHGFLYGLTYIIDNYSTE